MALVQRYKSAMQRAKLMVFAAIIFLFLLFLSSYIAFLRMPLIAANGQSVDFIFPYGANLVTLSNELNERGLLWSPRWYLVLTGILQGARGHLHAGEYRIMPGTLPMDLIQQVMEGRVLWRDFLVVEGTTFTDFRHALGNNPYLVHLTSRMTEKELSQKLGNEGKSLEGMFFPDTYRYTAGLSDYSILKQAYQAMQDKLNKAWQTRAPGLMYQNPYQALIVASLVEREAKLAADRPRIAGVILKRLKMGMALQIDASVIYGLGPAFDGKLKLVQLKIDTPYNTYLHKGLPPTPIALPGEASIQAALHPIINQDLFYVASGTGGHIFSATLSGQNRAVEHYRQIEHSKK